jgi:hypothetical protein
MGIELNFNPMLPNELQGQNAQRYISKFSVLCEHCLNAQTNIQGLKNISKEFNKGYVKVIWKFILDNNLKIFTKKELMEKMQLVDISDGVLQEKALSILIMLGYLRKEQQIWITEKKEEKTRYIYIKNLERRTPKCYDSEKDKHIEYNFFRDGIRKHYFRTKKKVED